MEDQAEYGVDVKNIKKRGGRWDPDKITEKTLIPKELADAILKEIQTLLERSFKLEYAVRIGTTLAIKRWEKKNADKSGG